MNRLTTLLPRFKFSTKLILGMVSVVLGFVLILAPLVGRMASRALVQEAKKRGSALAESLAARAVEPMLARDLLRLKNQVDAMKGVGQEMAYAFVMDDAGRVLAHSYPRGFPIDLLEVNHAGSGREAAIQLLDTGHGRVYDFAAPILIGGKSIGTVRVGLSRAVVQAEVNRLIVAISVFAGGALILAVAVSAVFAERVTRRLALLRQQAEEMVKGNLDIQTGPVLNRHCWELMDCNLTRCPAYGDARRRCWYLTGTLCPDCAPLDYPAKLNSCQHCPVYRANVGDEIQDLAETFDVMALTLKDHIQELKDAERAMSNQQRLMRTILDVTPDLVSLVDTRIIYQAANKAFANYVNATPEAVVGSTDFDLFDETAAETRNLESRDILQTGQRLDKELRIETGGRERWFHVLCVPVTDQEGRITGLLRTERDITDLKVYQEQLIQAQKMESLGKLAGGVAHEINTPLGVILGYAQLMQEDVPADSQMHDDLDIVVKQAQVCRKIVADLLGFSRQAESVKREMCFNNSVMEAISLVKHTFTMDRVEIQTELDDRFPIIFGDPEKLKQVWINLLNNARDAMPGGGVILVRTRLDTPVQKVHLWIIDTGTGIDPEHLGKIFDPFFSTKPVGKGTGLGLSVSFGIVEDHDGEIHVESPVPPGLRPTPPDGVEPGPGAAFIVDLPLDHAAPPPPKVRDEAQDAQQGA
ncbi:MAG: ATP-binding protein [Desulfovibrionaceae bacterium]